MKKDDNSLRLWYEEIIREVREVSGYIEWVEQGGEEVYGKRETAARWYHDLLEIAGEVLKIAIG